MSQPKVLVVMTTMNLPWTKKSVPDMIENTIYKNCEFFCIDDCTTEESSNWHLRWFSNKQEEDNICSIHVNVIGNRNGVAGCWNIGLKSAIDRDFDYVVILNNDIAFPPPKDDKCWLTRLVEIGEEEKEYGYISPAWHWTGEPENGGIESFKASCYDYSRDHAKQIDDGGIGCFFMLRISAAKETGYFDNKNFPTNWEEVDYLLRMRRLSWKTGVFHKVCLYHKGSGTTGSKEWHGVVRKDYLTGHVNFIKKWNLPTHINNTFTVHNGIYMYGKERTAAI